MKEALDFLTTSKIFYLATADNNTPHLRPMGFVMEHKGKLAFCTANEKAMCRQLAANPAIEISCVDANMNTLRLWGKAVFCTTPETQQKALETMPSLGKRYAVGDGNFEIFYLDEAKGYCTAMSGERKELEL